MSKFKVLENFKQRDFLLLTVKGYNITFRNVVFIAIPILGFQYLLTWYETQFPFDPTVITKVDYYGNFGLYYVPTVVALWKLSNHKKDDLYIDDILIRKTKGMRYKKVTFNERRRRMKSQMGKWKV